MKRVIISSLILGLLLNMPGVLSTNDTTNNIKIKTLDLSCGVYKYVDREILIQPNRGTTINELEYLLKNHRAYIKNTECLNKWGFAAVVIPEESDIFLIINFLKQNPIIRNVSLNYVGEVYTDDPYFNQQWALRKIKAEEGWDKFTKGDSSVVVAILDSGIYPLGYSIHEDICTDRLIVGGDFTESGTMEDSINHGLPMAGIVSAHTNNAVGMAGVTWNTKLLIVKVIRKWGGGHLIDEYWAAQGIHSVVDSAIANPNKRFVINCSWGFLLPLYDRFWALDSAIARADENNVLVVAAAGNRLYSDPPRPFDQTVRFPARFSGMNGDVDTFNLHCNVISVSGVDSSFYWGNYSCYKGTDECSMYVDLSAPGGPQEYIIPAPASPESVITLSSESYGAYKYSSQTSCATAYVSGAAALVWSLNPFLSHYEVKNILKGSATDPSNESIDYYYYPYWCGAGPGDIFPKDCYSSHIYEYHKKKGTGIINIEEALDRATKHGSIYSDVTWFGDIIIGGDITVNDGVTLTISSGSTVHILKEDFKSDGVDTSKVEIIVKGTLVIGESGGSGVIFKSYPQAGASSGDWIGITFDTTSTDNVLRNVEIKNAELAIKNYAPVELYGCTIDTTNSASLELHSNATIDSSIIYITCDTKVEAGDTLTIAGDSEFYISPVDSNNKFLDSLTVEFLVDGRLVVDGDAGSPVEFKSYAASPQEGDWLGIQFTSVNSSGTLDYCNISHAYHGVKSYVDIDMTHCTITDCEVHGIYLEGSNANGSEITYCEANGNGSAGIIVSSCDSVTIDECKTNDNYYGVELQNSDYATVEDINLKFNYYYGMKVSNSDYFEFDHCYADSNDQEGMYLNGAYGGTISRSRMKGNDGNGMLATGSGCNPFIDHCKFQDSGAAGVRANSSAFPVLGNQTLGVGEDNAIVNDVPRVYNNTGSTLDAENCWWGGTPFPLMFTGSVDYDPYLTSDPVTYLAPAINNKTIFSLSQNYPNPFRSGATTINYSIPNAKERVSLRIYDVSGRRVRTLVDKTQTAGQYKIKWDGRNDRGVNVAPGIYFYQLKLGDKALSKRIVLFR